LLRTIHDIEQKLQSHASAVISIASGTTCDAVKLRAIQPLCVAGRCLNTDRDKRLLIELLTSIEGDLGIATRYSVNALLKEWDLSSEDPGVYEQFIHKE
jgi:hypothetical protein